MKCTRGFHPILAPGGVAGDSIKRIPSTGELVYGAGIVVVLLNVADHQQQQRHYREHSGHVTALAVSCYSRVDFYRFVTGFTNKSRKYE